MIFGWKNKKAKLAAKPQTAPAIDIDKASPAVLLDIACSHTSSDIRLQAFAKLVTQDQFTGVLELGKYPDTRLLAAQQLVDEAPLRRAYASAKQKDKNAARVLKDKLALIDAERQQRQAVEAEINSVLSELEALAKAAWTPTYNSRFAGVKTRWARLGSAVSDINKQQYGQYAAAVEAELAANKPRIEAPLTQSSVCELLAQIASACQQASLIEAQIACFEWGILLDAEAARWREASLLQAPDDSARHDYTQLSQSLLAAVQLAKALNEECRDTDDFSAAGLARLGNVLRGIDWRLSEVPVWFGELATMLEEVKANQDRAQSIEAEARADIHKMFAALRRAISAGRLLPAKTLSGKLEKRIHSSGLDDAERYDEQLEKLNLELSQLMDWKDFATAPKYEQLCQAMEALADQPLTLESDPVDTRIAAVKSLQDQWRELGRSEISDTYWQQFQEAGHKAYAPAQTFFDELRQQRADNLASRRQLCERLNEALQSAIETQQWKTLEKTLFQVQRDWHRFRGVERKAGQEVKQRFDHLIERAEIALEPQYQAGVSAKQNLIDRMQALLEQDISQHVLHQAKELQTAWKVAGLTPRDQDQPLWQQFNALAQQLFAADREQRQQQRAQESSQFDQAKQLIDAVKQLSAEAPADSLDSLQKAFADLPIAAERGFDKLRDAFDKACAGFEHRREILMQASEQQAFVELQRRAHLCSQLEQRSDDNERDAVLAQWDEAPLDNKLWSQAIEQRKMQALAGAQAHAETTEQRRLLCVQLEIALELESPADDKALRMEYQLARLQNRENDTRPLADLVRDISIQWCLAEPAEATWAEPLERRFQQLLAAYRAG